MLGAESVGGFLCEEGAGEVLRDLGSAHQKAVAWGGMQAAHLATSQTRKTRLPASSDLKLGLYKEGCSQSPAQPTGSDCQPSVGRSVSLSVCQKDMAFQAVKSEQRR